MMENYIEYIIRFLLGDENADKFGMVSYGYRTDSKIIIEPSGFFDDDTYLTEATIPQLPLKKIDGLPILFGEPRKEIKDGKLYLYADIIASTFYLITRYEECLRREIRDAHGRFIGKESIAYKGGFLERPIVEEWGGLLTNCLRQMGIPTAYKKEGFSHIYLTHDVDNIWTWDNFICATRSVLGSAIKKRGDFFLPYRALCDYKTHDPAYTFPWFFKIDTKIQSSVSIPCDIVYFLMGTINKTEYDRGYAQKEDATKQLIKYVLDNGAKIGYHASYQSSMKLELQKYELQRIKNYLGRDVKWNRNHYLASREPEDFLVLIENGITDDFTMGFADVVGFRLGTCRKVRWINPMTRVVTSLCLHPLTVMDGTLNEGQYMNIQEEDIAYQIVKQIINHIYIHKGEVVLLWHNTTVSCTNGSYHKSLYERVVSLLEEKCRIKLFGKEESGK